METMDKMKVSVVALGALSSAIDLLQGQFGSAASTIGVTSVLAAELAERFRAEAAAKKKKEEKGK